MLIKEFRIILPMTVEEYQVAQLWSVAEASKNETGGGEGIEVITNEPYNPQLHVPSPPMLGGDPQYVNGQYTYKKYHLQSKVPGFVRFLAPKGSLEFEEKAWNAYPYCRTIINNPGFMKDKFIIKIESMHIQDSVELENVHQLGPEDLAKREIIYIDIANDPLLGSHDYKPEFDPTKFQSAKTGRGPLVGPQWWKKYRNSNVPVMCAYKLVTCEFKWLGLQGRVETLIQKQERRLFQNFHRQVVCWMDNWHGLTMTDIRAIEEKTKQELADQMGTGTVRGTVAEE